jgi:hypothetical protein
VKFDMEIIVHASAISEFSNVCKATVKNMVTV